MHSYDHSELESYLQNHVPGFSTLDGMDKFSDGQSNPTYRVTSGSTQYVLRAKPPGPLLKSAHAVDREYRVMKALETSDVPVPKMLHLSGEQSPLGPQFFVMEMVEGRILWDPALPGETKESRAAIYTEMNRVLAALHSVDLVAAGLEDYGRPGNYFERQLARWTKQYHAAATDELAEVNTVIDWLGAHMAPDDGQSAIVHGDYRIDNMIFDAQSPRILAILDWELSTLGHPLADLAYQCMHWRLPHEGKFRGLGGVDRAALGLPDEARYVADYCAQRGIEPPQNWNFYLVFCYFRLLAILQGIVKRAHDGTASNPSNIHQMSEIVGFMAREALALTR